MFKSKRIRGQCLGPHKIGLVHGFDFRSLPLTGGGPLHLLPFAVQYTVFSMYLTYLKILMYFSLHTYRACVVLCCIAIHQDKKEKGGCRHGNDRMPDSAKAWPQKIKSESFFLFFFSFFVCSQPSNILRLCPRHSLH